MATVTLNPIVDSISGTIGRMVFYKRYGHTISRAWIMPPNPDTPAQKKNRSFFRDAMKSWQALSVDEKAAYNRRARKLSMSGHNLFISRYMKAAVGAAQASIVSPVRFMEDDGGGLLIDSSSSSSPSRTSGRMSLYRLRTGCSNSNRLRRPGGEVILLSGLPLRHCSVGAGMQ